MTKLVMVSVLALGRVPKDGSQTLFASGRSRFSHGLEPGDNWAPLPLVDGKLLVRGQKELKALQVAR